MAVCCRSKGLKSVRTGQEATLEDWSHTLKLTFPDGEDGRDHSYMIYVYNISYYF